MSKHWDGYSWVDGPGDGRQGGWIQTFTGRKFWPLDPRLEDIDLRDIAFHLSNQVRFSGAAGPYSVAQHCVLVTRLVEKHGPEVALWALLHDAPEAYLVDLPRPLKHSPGFEAYTAAEENLMRVVCRFAGLPFAEPDVVEEADQILLATERRELLGPGCHWEVPGVEPLDESITPWPHHYAYMAFMGMFDKLSWRLKIERETSAANA